MILELPDVVNAISDEKGFGNESKKETAGAIGSVLGGICAGAKGGAIGGAISSKNPVDIAIGAVARGAIGGFVGDKIAENSTEILINTNPVNESQLLERGIIKPML